MAASCVRAGCVNQPVFCGSLLTVDLNRTKLDTTDTINGDDDEISRLLFYQYTCTEDFYKEILVSDRSQYDIVAQYINILAVQDLLTAVSAFKFDGNVTIDLAACGFQNLFQSHTAVTHVLL